MYHATKNRKVIRQIKAMARREKDVEKYSAYLHGNPDPSVRTKLNIAQREVAVLLERTSGYWI